MTRDEVQFGVLGPLQLRVNEVEPRLGTRKQRAVLAILVINRNRPVGIEKIIDGVWGSAPPTAARSNVHTYVSNVRRLISDAGGDPNGVLARAPGGYEVIAADTQCDVGRFEAARTSGLMAAAAGRFEQASRHLGGALAQWRGQVLDDLRDFSFVSEFARAQIENKLTAVIAYAEAEIACGRAHSVITQLEDVISEFPHREPVWAQLITAYYLTGRQADALDAYHKLKGVLADDLGVDPGAEIRALFNRVVRQLPLDAHTVAQSNAERTILLDREGVQVDSATPEPAALLDSNGDRHPLVGNSTRIGRSRDNDIIVVDPSVSRNHAVIVDKKTHFEIIDLESANGVYVLGQRITGSAVLHHRDPISLGDHQFSFEVPAGDQAEQHDQAL